MGEGHLAGWERQNIRMIQGGKQKMLRRTANANRTAGIVLDETAGGVRTEYIVGVIAAGYIAMWAG